MAIKCADRGDAADSGVERLSARILRSTLSAEVPSAHFFTLICKGYIHQFCVQV
jgi:hypothetical protein